MSLAQVRNEQIIYGLSTDTKPQARGTDTWFFRETDTGKEYIWDGDSWVENTGHGGPTDDNPLPIILGNSPDDAIRFTDDLLGEILKELITINFHLALLSDAQGLDT